MKIVLTNHKENLIFNGISAALYVVEPNTVIWNSQYKPAFDMLDEIKPDLFICMSKDLNSDLIRGINEYKIPTILFGLSNQITPVLTCFDNTASEIAVNNTPNALIVKPAANAAQLNHGKYNTKYGSDILYISNQPYPQVLPLLTQIPKEFICKVCGDIPLPLPNYIGKTNVKTLSNLIASTKIIIDYNFNSLYDAAYNGIFCLSNLDNDLFPTYTSVSDFNEKLEHFTKDEKHRKYYIKEAGKKVINNTYYHRVNDIFKAAGLHINMEKYL